MQRLANALGLLFWAPRDREKKAPQASVKVEPQLLKPVIDRDRPAEKPVPPPVTKPREIEKPVEEKAVQSQPVKFRLVIVYALNELLLIADWNDEYLEMFNKIIQSIRDLKPEAGCNEKKIIFFNWPLAQNKAIAPTAQAAAEVLEGFLTARANSGIKQVIVLGDQLKNILSEKAVSRCGLKLHFSHSLQQMSEDVSKKRHLWRLIQQVVRKTP